MTITILADTIDEADETFTVSFGTLPTGRVTAGTDNTATVTITDDDVPEVTFNPTAVTVAEGAGTVSVTVQLDRSPAAELVIPVQTANSTATAGSDYTGLTSTNVTFAAGTRTTAVTETVTITILADTIDEADETFTVSFGTLPAGRVTAGTDNTATVTITDNDEPTVTLSVAPTTISEADVGTTATLTVTLSSVPDSTVVIPVVIGGTASAGNDYTLSATSVSFSPTETSKTVTITVMDDSIDDNAETIELSVNAAGIVGVTAGITTSVTITITDDDDAGAVPDAPTNLAAMARSAAQIDLSWTAPVNTGSSALTGYLVELSEDGGTSYDEVTVTGTTYAHISLSAATAYMYRVSAINAVGTSAASSTVTASTLAAMAPGAPTGLTATAVSGSQIDLSWAAPTNTGGSAITGYLVERAFNNDANYLESASRMITGNVTSYSYSPLSDDSTHFFRVSAMNVAGTSPVSLAASATTFTFPDAPINLTATVVGQTQISLSWTAPVNNGGSAITGYRIQLSTTSANSGFSDLVADTTSTTGTATTYNHINRTAGTTYHYRVSAISTVGVGSFSSTATATTAVAGEQTAPGMPTALMARATGSSTVELSWTAPANDGGSTVTGYRVESAAFGFFTDLQANTGNAVTTYTHTGGIAQVEYTYRVSAINAEGTGLASDVATIITVNAPQNLQARPVGVDMIQLRWREPSTFNNFVITDYQLEVSTNGADFTDLQTLGSDARAYSHTGLTAGNTRHYRIYATHEGGRSDATAVVMATTAAVTPSSPPRNLTATASGVTQINLSWAAPEDNGGSDITGYRIAVSTSGGPRTFSALVEDTGDTTTYSHTDLSAGGNTVLPYIGDQRFFHEQRKESVL